jgi:tight adherence protein B
LETFTVTATFPSLMTFLAVVTAIGGVYSVLTDLFLGDRSRIKERIDFEFVKRKGGRARKLSLFRDPDQLALELPDQDDQDRGLGLRRRFEAMVEESGLSLSPARLLAHAIAAGIVAAGIGGLLAHQALGAFAAAPIGAALPVLYVNRVRNLRVAKLLGQLPDAFELMSRVVRSGQTIAMALRAVADEFPSPVASEFALCYEQQNLGLSIEAALRDLARRTGLLEMKIFVLALVVQQQTGGNLAELLDKLSSIIRERFQIHGQIRTLTAEGRIQAVVLLILPVVMFGLILFFNEDYAGMLLERPELLIGCLVSEGIGALWIRHIINFDF